MSKRVKRGSTALVKIDSILYKQMKEFVNLNKLQYPSVKNFAEQAIMRSLGFKRYDIEGVDYEKSADKPLVNVVGEPEGHYVICHICGKTFFIRNSDDSRVCSSCTAAIKQVVKSIKEEKIKKRKFDKYNKFL